MSTMRAAIYARTSTVDQHTANQVVELREYCRRRGWTVKLEYVDDGVSGTTTSRPALDCLIRDASRARFDVLVVWRLDRLGRSLRGLVLLLDDLTERGVAFVSLNDGVDLSTAGGRLQAQLLAAFAEYERSMIADRVRLGLARARREGKRIGRPPMNVTPEQLAQVAHLSLTAAARELDVSKSAVAKWRKAARR